MDKKEVGRIFEKFYRTKRAEQSGEAGTGIGLSIVEQIVDATWRIDPGGIGTRQGLAGSHWF